MAKKSVPKKPVPSKAGSSKIISSKPGPSKSGSSKSGSSKATSSKTVPSKAASSKIISVKAVSVQPVSSKKSSEKTVLGNPNPIAAHMNLTLLEVADPTDLSALMADTRVGSLIAARLSDSSAIITPDKTDALLKALKDGGHTPKIVRLENTRGEA